MNLKAWFNLSLYCQIALHVFSLLSPNELVRAGKTCHTWKTLADDNSLWKGNCRESGICPPTAMSNPAHGYYKSEFVHDRNVYFNWRNRPLHVMLGQHEGVSLSDHHFNYAFLYSQATKYLRGHTGTITCLEINGDRWVMVRCGHLERLI